MAHDAFEYLITLFCCCISRQNVSKFNTRVEGIAKMDREVKKGLSTIESNLDVESMIMLN